MFIVQHLPGRPASRVVNWVRERETEPMLLNRGEKFGFRSAIKIKEKQEPTLLEREREIWFCNIDKSKRKRYGGGWRRAARPRPQLAVLPTHVNPHLSTCTYRKPRPQIRSNHSGGKTDRATSEFVICTNLRRGAATTHWHESSPTAKPTWVRNKPKWVRVAME